MSLTAVARADTRRLPLRDRSVDLIVTSPPYFALRDYGYPGQIGIETTPADFLEALWACTTEWMRVLKPEGSLFVNLGDKYSQYEGARKGHGRDLGRPERRRRDEPLAMPVSAPLLWGVPAKSLMGLPWRYAIGCIDRLGLILRAEIIWSKVNGLPESVTDRARRSHEQMFHFVKQPRYYSAVDDIRERTTREGLTWEERKIAGHQKNPDAGHNYGGPGMAAHSLGKLPGSVWEPVNRQTLRALLKDVARGTTSPEDAERQLSDGMPGVWHIPSAPLVIPERLGVDHFAAFPPALVRPIVAGWSPPAICTACGEGRRPAAHVDYEGARPNGPKFLARAAEGALNYRSGKRALRRTEITGYVCACTPYTDHPGGGESSSTALHARPKVGPWREYHLDGWQPPPGEPAVVLDPFGGTGTTALVASVLGRRGVTLDLSAEYGRAAAWRVTDPAERARALDVPKPPPVPDGQGELFESGV